MAVDHVPVTKFEDWYDDYRVNVRDDTLQSFTVAQCGSKLFSKYEDYKREMDTRVANYWKLEALADGEVISKKADLPNISSGETAGMVRRMARNLVQHTPNLEITSAFDDDKIKGIFTHHVLLTKIVGEDHYSNDMQQNLFASTKTALTLGFDTVIPVLLQDAAGGWYFKYDAIHYRDVFPEPGARDVRQATSVFIRRYLTKGDVMALIRTQPTGWDIQALRKLVQTRPPSRESQSVDIQTRKHGQIPEGYEIITWYNSFGDPFLTFERNSKMLLRIEKNKDLLKRHPVFFLVLEKDSQQPLGKSQVELVLGRQEFQDLLLNGAMKQYYRNINPAIIGYGTVNALPNLGPGKYTEISNPNARIEAFEVSTQTLLQFGQISTQNAGNMVQLIGAADQQMATQSTGGQMSATPQGVEAQQQMVDITSNNYQKAIEFFFSQYCSYALTMYFQELKGVKKVTPTADTRRAMLGAGLDPGAIDENGEMSMDFNELAVEFFVKTVPGSLVELEDEKQLRVLNQMFVALSQSMGSLAATQDPQIINTAAKTMQFIIMKELELSGSVHSRELAELLKAGPTPEFEQFQTRIGELESTIDGERSKLAIDAANAGTRIEALEQNIGGLAESLGVIMKHMGVENPASAPEEAPVPV